MKNRCSLKNNSGNVNKTGLFIIAMLFVAIIIIGFMIGDKEKINEILDNTAVETVTSSETSVIIGASANLALSDFTNAVLEDVQTAKEEYGIDLSKGLDGKLDLTYLNTNQTDKKTIRVSSYMARNFDSSQDFLEEAVLNAFGDNNVYSEMYIDIDSGNAVDGNGVLLGNVYSSGLSDTGKIISDSESIKKYVSDIVHTADKNHTVVTETETGYKCTCKFYITRDFIDRIPNEFYLERNIDKQQVLKIFEGLENSNMYEFPAEFTVNFVYLDNKYYITDTEFKGSLKTKFDKSFDELIEMGIGNKDNLPEDYRFGVKGDLNADIVYKNTYTY